MSDEEAEIDRTRDCEGSVQPRGSDAEPATDESAVDRAAESFVALESELRESAGESGRRAGLAEDVERIPGSAAPDDYPLSITTEEALRIRVVPADAVTDLPDEQVSVYFEWPPDDDGPLARLLALRDVEPHEFADLHGDSIPLTVEAGYLVPRLPPGGHPGDSRGVYGVVAGLAANLLVLLLGLLGFGSILPPAPELLALVVVNFVVLPVSTYLDARHLLTTTDWEQGPPFWATLAAIPGVNVLSSLAYLASRRNAKPL